MKNYDKIQNSHYNKVAAESGTKPTSTMADIVVRDTETSSIMTTIQAWIERNKKSIKDIDILDAGCGNGFTIDYLAKNFPTGTHLLGLEYNKELLKLAQSRNSNQFVWGDLFDKDSLPKEQFDIVILQRVLINIQDPNHQISALENVVSLLKPGGLLIAIEAFSSGLDLINQARAEFNLEAVSMPYHNYYLDENFFLQSEKIKQVNLGVSEYFLSTHYYLSYVLYPALCQSTNANFNRSSFFVKFFDKLLPNQGQFGANRFLTYMKVEHDG
jgi:SAM-dependent methyltransferase